MANPGGALLLQTNLTCIRFEDGNKLMAYASLLPIAAIVFQLGAAWQTRCACRAQPPTPHASAEADAHPSSCAGKL